MGDLVWSGGLIGRVFVPKAAFAVSAIGTSLVNLVLALGAYMLIALILGARIHASVLFLPVHIFLSPTFLPWELGWHYPRLRSTLLT